MRHDIAKCLDVVKRGCQKYTLRVVQLTRIKMEDLDALIKVNPDWYVVYYTRDKINHLFDKQNRSIVRKAEYICEKMREDIRQRTILQNKYPGAFTHLIYERPAADPEGFAKRIYGTFNQTDPKQWNHFIAMHMNGRGNIFGFGVTVGNATKTA